MKHILLTGFEPFGGEAINPSWLAVQQFAQQFNQQQAQLNTPEYQLHCLQLPVTFADCFSALEPVLTAQPMDLVLCVGQAGGRTHIGLEKVAINYAHARIPDNAGAQPLDQPLIADGPDAYFSTLPLHAMHQACVAAQVPTQISYSAGTYVCNALFYRLMHFLRSHQPATQAGFIHIPYAPNQVLTRADASLSTAHVVTALAACIEAAFGATSGVLSGAAGALD